MLEAAVDADLGVHVIWAPMLGSDKEEAAREISQMFNDPRVKQYWDADRLLGTSYSADVYPTYMTDMQRGMEATLPADHWWRGQDRDWSKVKPRQAPLWDVALTYDKGIKWDAAPPAPSGMIKQVLFYGELADGPSGMFFTDFKKAPAGSDWIKEVAPAMTQLTGSKPSQAVSTANGITAAPLAGCQGGGSHAMPFVFKLDAVANSEVQAVEKSVAAMKDVTKATYDANSKIITVFAKAGGSATNDRIMKFLALAGYDPQEPSESELLSATQAIKRAGPVVRRPAKEEESRYPDTIAGMMAHSFIEAFNSGDPEKVRVAAETDRSKSALESSSMDERLEQYTQLYRDWGRLEVQAFEEHEDGSLTLIVKPDRGFSGLNLEFGFEKTGGKIDEIRITPAMLGDDGRDEANDGVLGDVTILNDSLDPLRKHFNANKDKHRFIAILSPT